MLDNPLAFLAGTFETINIIKAETRGQVFHCALITVITVVRVKLNA